jgi:regulator of protease activity HflC (stomatin/prohibitin superfamily)
LLTGDGNLLEVQGSVRYTIEKPRQFLFTVGNPTKALRNAVESVLRDVVASRRMAELLTLERGVLGNEVKRRIESRCEEMGLGVKLEGVSLHDLHPPQEVVQAYHEVTKAMERRDREVNLAEEFRLRRLRDQEARSLEIVRQAEAEAFERVRHAQARRVEFQARQRVRNTLDWREEMSLFGWAFDEIERGQPISQVGEALRKKRQQRRAEQAALVDYRLYWDSLTQTLAGRAKVIVDVDKLPGRRSLWLVPFEPMPAPALAPRGPRRQGSDEP